MTARLPELKPPYLLFLGDVDEEGIAKTASGVLHWRPEKCLGQLRLPGCAIDLGLPDMTPAEAGRQGAGTLIIGVANMGGFIPDSWIEALREALAAGLDIAAGLHSRLSDIAVLRDEAARRGRRIYDIRQPDQPLPVGSGRKRSGNRLLTVGTDCSVGKMYAALALTAELKDRGVSADFRATGQTGIFIAGRGISVDAVVADFISGAAELLSPDNEPDHWDLVEGQGSLFHPAYAGVSLGLLHGSQPDAIVLCHEAMRDEIQLMPGFAVPDLGECINRNLAAARLTNPDVRAVGVSVNTSKLSEARARDYLAELSERLGLPACDPVRTGIGPIADLLLENQS